MVTHSLQGASTALAKHEIIFVSCMLLGLINFQQVFPHFWMWILNRCSRWQMLWCSTFNVRQQQQMQQRHSRTPVVGLLVSDDTADGFSMSMNTVSSSSLPFFWEVQTHYPPVSFLGRPLKQNKTVVQLLSLIFQTFEKVIIYIIKLSSPRVHAPSKLHGQRTNSLSLHYTYPLPKTNYHEQYWINVTIIKFDLK